MIYLNTSKHIYKGTKYNHEKDTSQPLIHPDNTTLRDQPGIPVLPFREARHRQYRPGLYPGAHPDRSGNHRIPVRYPFFPVMRYSYQWLLHLSVF